MSDHGNVVRFGGKTKLELPPEGVLESAAKLDFEWVVVVGKLKNGERYLAFSDPDVAHALWELKRAEELLLRNSSV